MRVHTLLRWTLCGALLFCPAISRGEEQKGKFEVHDISLWILDPGSTQANSRTAYSSSLPVTVTSGRTTPNAGVATKSAPTNLLRFYGPPAVNLDVDMRTKSGGFVAHWPIAEVVPNRLRWAGAPALDLVEREDESALVFVDAEHWFSKARQGDALYLRRGARAERFLAYDAELNIAPPVRLEGGPDTFKVINTSNTKLYDVMVSRGTPQGRRVAWIDVLEPSQGATTAVAPKPEPGGKPAGDLFDDAKEKKAAKPVSPKLFGGLLKKADKPSDKAETKAPAAEKPVADVKPAETKPAEAPAPPIRPAPVATAAANVEVTLGNPLPPGSGEATAQTTEAWKQRLAKTGLRDHEITLLVDQYASLLFEGDAVVVACRLEPSAIDEKISLSIFPEPAKTVRVATVVMRNADPALGTEVERLVAQLGDTQFAARESAHKRLIELGPLAFGSLNRALNNSDLEIVIRAERILLAQNQTPNPQAGAAPAAGKLVPTGAAAPAAAPVLRRVVVPAK